MHAAAAGLTDREAEILRLLANGCSNQEIAAKLVVSVRTVERHLRNAYRKNRPPQPRRRRRLHGPHQP
jgi:DNA-binding CsgD family transcriptional regulator